MSQAESAYNFDRYCRLLAEASDEAKRLAFIQLLIDEKARDRLAAQTLRAKVPDQGLRTEAPAPHAAPPNGENAARKPR